MANATVSRLGQIEGAGSTTALFLKLFAGEVLAAFQTATVTEGKHLQRVIPHGQTAQFPATWKATASLHTPGAEIVGQVIKHDEVTISIDGLLISDVFISNLDEAQNHYDVRSIYTKEVGEALARQKDTDVLRNMIKSARGTEIFASESYDGTQVENASMKTDATVLASGIFTAAQTLDEQDVPESQVRSCFLRPAQYYLLAANKDLLNKDWGGQGSFAEAMIPQVAGVELVKTNLLPITDETPGSEIHKVDAATTAAVVNTPWAVATVKLMDLKVESAYDIRRQGHLVVARYAMGHGALRPETAIELRTGAP